MSPGVSGLRGVHEVYIMIHDASVRHLASHGGPHNGCDSIIGAVCFQCNAVVARRLFIFSALTDNKLPVFSHMFSFHMR